MSTFGGAASSETAGELSSLREAVYYWGHPQQTSVDDGSLHLRLAWFGKPAFDVAAAGAWSAKVFAAERAFFADDESSSYSVFVRVLQSHEDRANGIGQETSYLSWIGPRTTFARRLKVNMAHEMLHRWLGLRLRLRGPEGTAYWFSEGFTVHYSNVIAFRAGLLSVDELLESLNDVATRHFDNKHAGATNDAIRRGFYRDQALSIVPYTRGALYAAELDAALRRASHGKRTLDDALRDLYREARTGRGRDGLPADAVRRLVQAELGRAGVARYDAVIVRGRHPDPPTDAYGPCFTRKPRKSNGFEWVRVPGVADAKCRAW
jgi:predicted metalloprotease with PDZ domain